MKNSLTIANFVDFLFLDAPNGQSLFVPDLCVQKGKFDYRGFPISKNILPRTA